MTRCMQAVGDAQDTSLSHQNKQTNSRQLLKEWPSEVTTCIRLEYEYEYAYYSLWPVQQVWSTTDIHHKLQCVLTLLN